MIESKNQHPLSSYLSVILSKLGFETLEGEEREKVKKEIVARESEILIKNLVPCWRKIPFAWTKDASGA